MRLSILFLLLLFPFSYASSSNGFKNHQINSMQPISQKYENKFVLNRQHLIAQGMHIDLTEMLDVQEMDILNPAKIYIIADTVEISKPLLLSLKNQNLFIFAREIVGKHNASIFFRPQSNSSTSMIRIFTQSIVPNIKVSLYENGVFQSFNATIKDGAGVQIFHQQGQLVRESITYDISSDLDNNEEAIYGLLNQTFNMASQLADSKPQVSLSMLDWITNVLSHASSLTSQSSDFMDLYLQAASLALFQRTNLHDSAYIPYLAKQMYVDEYESYLEVMQEYQEQLERYEDIQYQSNEKKTTAQLMLDHVKTSQEIEQRIIDQHEIQLAQIEKGLKQLQEQMSQQKRKVFDAHRAFRVGLKVWEHDNRLKMAFELFNALVSFGTTIAEAVTGNITGLGDIADSIKNLSNSVTQSSILVKKIDLARKNITQINTSIEEINKMATSLKTNEANNKVIKKFSDYKFSLPSPQQSNSMWDTMLVGIQTDMATPINHGVNGARGYQAELHKLIIFAKAINEMQIRIAQKKSLLVNLSINAEHNLSKQASISTLISHLDTQESNASLLYSHFQRSYFGMQRNMYIALSQYKAAFEYWALTPSRVKPKLNAQAQDYARDLTVIQNEYNQTLLTFSNQPQNFVIDDFVITDPKDISSFQRNGSLTITIDVDEPSFQQYERVRLKTVRVIFEGNSLPSHQEWDIDIHSNGRYRDHYQNKHYQFFSEKNIFRRFSYKTTPNNSSQEQYAGIFIQTDGDVSEEYRFAYFEPTPFSTWTIHVPSGSDHISNVNQIRFIFEGNAIPIPSI